MLAINPKSAIAYNNIGVALATQANLGNAKTDPAKLDQAIAEYRRPSMLNPATCFPITILVFVLLYP